MSTTVVRNIQWLDHNAQRRYPLADDATGIDTSGTFTLPNEFIVSLDLPINASENVVPGNFFIRSVSCSSNGYGVTVGYQPASGPSVIVATALIPAEAHTTNKIYTLGGIGDFSDSVGKIVIGKLDEISMQPPGFWQFALAAGRLDPDAIRPMIRGVTSIVVVNGVDRSLPLQGVIALEAGRNMQLVPVVSDGNPPKIRFNAISGEGLIDDCVCEGDVVKVPITSINGVSGNGEGSFKIVPDTCIQITNLPNGIRIGNSCASMCCNCTDLETITRDLEHVGGQVTTLDSFSRELATKVETMQVVVLASKLNDNGCSSC